MKNLKELIELNEKLMEVVNQANKLDRSKQAVRLLIADLDDAKKRLFQIIGEATVISSQITDVKRGSLSKSTQFLSEQNRKRA